MVAISAELDAVHGELLRLPDHTHVDCLVRNDLIGQIPHPTDTLGHYGKYFGNGSVLYPELVADVDVLGLGSERVTYFRSLFDLNRWVGPPSEEIIEELPSGVMKSTGSRNELFLQTSPDVVGVPLLPYRSDDTSSPRARSGGDPLVVAASSLVDVALYDALVSNEAEAWAKFPWSS